MSILQQPIGEAADPVFAVQDLLDVDREFSTSGAYFGNEHQNVICIRSPFDWRDEICAPKAVGWQPVAYASVQAPCVATPEPSYGIGAVALVLLGVVLILRFRGRRG